MTCVLDILDPSGHLTLSWTVDDPESISAARTEFDRLKAAGYAFFATPTPRALRVTRLKDAALTRDGALDVRPEQIREFSPRARRTVAVRPMAGG